MLEDVHFFPGMCLLGLGLGLQYALARALQNAGRSRSFVLFALLSSTLLVLLGYFLEFDQLARLIPVWWATWIKCASLVWTIGLAAASVLLLVWRATPEFRLNRRRFLQAASAGLCMAPVAASGIGVVKRNQFQLVEIPVAIPNLPRDLQGLRIVQ